MATRSTVSNQFSMTVQSTITNSLDTAGKASTASLSGEIIDETISQGVEGDQISRAWEEVDIAISSGGTVDIDIRDMAGRNIGAGLGKDALGQDILFEEIVGLVIKNANADGVAGVLEINPVLPSPAWGVLPLYTARNAVGGGIKAGGVRAWFEPHAQALDVAGSAKIRLGAVGGDVIASVYVFGRHDDEASSESSSSNSSSSSSSVSSSSSSTA